MGQSSLNGLATTLRGRKENTWLGERGGKNAFREIKSRQRPGTKAREDVYERRTARASTNCPPREVRLRKTCRQREGALEGGQRFVQGRSYLSRQSTTRKKNSNERLWIPPSTNEQAISRVVLVLSETPVTALVGKQVDAAAKVKGF